LVKSPVRVFAPGGRLDITVDAQYSLTLKGPVTEVYRGRFSGAFLPGVR
jgi:diaminopimelate epimerase